MADGLSREIVRSTDEQSLSAPVPIGSAGATRRTSFPHAPKFLAVTTMLIGIAVGALAVAIMILVTNKSTGPVPQWSQWRPPDSGIAGEREIADQVSPLYRASPSEQLVVVTVHNISATGNGGQLALRDPNTGNLSSVSGDSAVYTLCGLGPNCSIATGAPSSARLLLLRREALELALYTFKYIGGIQNVVSILPPGRTVPTGQLTRRPPAPGKAATSTPVDLAVVFQKDSLTHFLTQPLRGVLPEDLPPTVAQMSSAPEAELVSILTGQALFTQQMITAQDGSNVLVLKPVPPQ